MTLYQSRQSTTLVNNTTKHVYLQVPKGKIWRVHHVMMNNGDDVNRTMSITIVDKNNNVLHPSTLISNATPSSNYNLLPNLDTQTYNLGFNYLIIKGENKLKLSWNAGGESSGGTAYYCVTYEEVPE